MFQFLLPFLHAMGTGSSAVPLATGSMPSLAAMGGGTLESMGAAAQDAAIASGTASAVPLSWTIGSEMAPNLSAAVSSLKSGNIGGAAKTLGGSLANMLGGENLANMVANPSWNNLGKIGEGVGDKMAANMVTQGLMGQPQQPVPPPGPGAVSNPKTAQAPQQIQENPILQRMFNNLNPQFQATPMKPWPPSPYPRRMSAI